VSAIFLIRHGPIALELDRLVEARQFVELLEAVDATGIRPDRPPPPELLRLVRSSDCFVSSDLLRSRESAALLAQGRPVQEDPLYREIPLRLRLPWKLRLPLTTLVWILLLLRRVGFSGEGESVQETRERAAAAARALAAVAAQGSTVVLVAHAMINRQIAGALRRAGWKGSRRPDSRHWGATLYRRP
jgi:broad specificity phosphatase PhoE